jgi:hypothetical protein
VLLSLAEQAPLLNLLQRISGDNPGDMDAK